MVSVSLLRLKPELCILAEVGRMFSHSNFQVGGGGGQESGCSMRGRIEWGTISFMGYYYFPHMPGHTGVQWCCCARPPIHEGRQTLLPSRTGERSR